MMDNNALHVTQIGAGQVKTANDSWVLTVPPTPPGRYSDAQIASYQKRSDFTVMPGIRMTVRARVEGEVRGTAGFGFWNHPFVPGERGFRLPKAIWFFYGSPPNEMRLAYGIAGNGWKAATFDATRWQFLALLPTAPIGVLLMRIPFLYRYLWPVGQRAIGVHEYPLDSDLLAQEHTYTIEWRQDRVQFWVDDKSVLEANIRVRGPLGFIAWIDNQYAVVTPQGKLGAGLVEVKTSQSLIVSQLEFLPLTNPHYVRTITNKSSDN